jgi:hypothetical protein
MVFAFTGTPPIRNTRERMRHPAYSPNDCDAAVHPSSEAEGMRGVQMESEIKVGQRFKFNLLSDSPSPERQAVVTRVLSNREEGLGPEVDYYLAYWVEANELPETEVVTPLVFERGIDGNVYLDGRVVTITLLE